MNEKTEVKETENNEFMEGLMAFLEYALNKYMPLALVTFICFYTLGYETWEPFVVVGLMLFSNHFNFKCGYVHGNLDKNGWDIDD